MCLCICSGHRAGTAVAVFAGVTGGKRKHLLHPVGEYMRGV